MKLNVQSQQFTNFDVKMAWNIKTIDRKTVIEGVFQNIRYSRMEDSNGKSVSRAVELLTPRQMDLSDSTAFRVILQTLVEGSL